MPLTFEEIRAEIQKLPSMAALLPERYAEVDGLADNFVQIMPKGKLNPTQLRKVFHQIKDLQREFKHGDTFNRGRIALIMPTLAYAKGRDLIPNEFYQLMTLSFGKDKCRTREDFESAASFLEAIMAYHKYYSKTGGN